ncbi:hypothetical protein [Sphingomonas sp. LHG3406-1]|uniref:hypothetical protein n=1 Tax=Sphingomonas sp. LHG3406-1 TaxID=2804617 RepID=UPI002638F533|nr:hypothetical protein [Sphingomonas sp. LHG3406-1]
MIIAATLLLSLQAAATPPATADVKPKKVCRTIEDTGTRMSRTRVCKYPEDWARDKQQAEDFATSRQLDVNRPIEPSRPPS